MGIIIQILFSGSFWISALIACFGGAVVFWGLAVEKSAEKNKLPDDYADQYPEIIAEQKRKMERGWRILMLGIVIEVVAAFIMSIVSSVEKIQLTEATIRAETQLQKITISASNALDTARDAQARVAPRHISPEARGKFIALVKSDRKGRVDIAVASGDLDSYRFAQELFSLIQDSGYDLRGNPSNRYDYSFINASGPTLAEVGVGIMDGTKAPAFALPLVKSLGSIGINAKLVGAQGLVAENDVVLIVSPKQRQ